LGGEGNGAIFLIILFDVPSNVSKNTRKKKILRVEAALQPLDVDDNGEGLFEIDV